MTGYRFFEEYRDPACLLRSGNVIAVDYSDTSFVQHGGVCYRAVVPQPPRASPNSAVGMELFNAEYLGARCRRVSEAQARLIHPRLFEYLERLA